MGRRWAARTPTRFYIYNSKSFLDQPGEFCMDASSRTLYYRPRRTPIEQQAIIAPNVDRLLSIDGASAIQFEGLTFKVCDGLLEVAPSLPLDGNIRGGLIHLGDAKAIVIKDCRLMNSAQNGVIVEGDIEKCTIYGNLITQTMSGGVRFVGGNNRDNVIENNYMHHVGEGIYVRNNIIDLDGPDLLPPFTVFAGYRRANVAVDAPPIHNHNYTYENNIVWSSSGAVFQIGGKADKQTFKRVDNNVYHNPAGRYSFRQMIQSGHSRRNRNYEMIARDYALTPAKPVVDGEPGYENITEGLQAAEPGIPRLTAADVRRFAYCGVFAGAAGHTYGCNEIYQFWTEGTKSHARWGAEIPWKQALDLPCARQMQHLRRLVESRPRVSRVPDQDIIEGDTLRTVDRIHGRLRVTPDGHYPQHEDGTPFFWLADTAWKLRSLSKADIDVYLKDRAARQFNVVMFNVADPAGPGQAFRGAKPLDAVRFSESCWAHNDYIVDQAARHGLYVVVIAGWWSTLLEKPGAGTPMAWFPCQTSRRFLLGLLLRNRKSA